MFKMLTVIGYLFLRFVGVVFTNCIFLDRGFSPVYSWNSAKFLLDFRELGYFRNFLPYSLGVEILIFQTGYGILFALRDLEWILRNWDPLKVMRRLPCVGLSGRGVTRKPKQTFARKVQKYGSLSSEKLKGH